MGLFGRKVREDEYEKAQNQLNQEPISKAAERIIFDEIVGDDHKTLHYVDQMKDGHPLVLNFEHVDVPTANKVLAFLAGATYVLEGQTVKIDEKIYLFARGEDFLDQSLDLWLKDLKN